MPLIQDKHALRKRFSSIDSYYSYPEYEGKNLSHLQRPEWVVFPNIRAWVGWIIWFKPPFQKFTNVMVQCLIGPRFFWFDEFIKLSYFALLLNVWSMVNFRFQNILNRKLMNIFISVPKTLDSSDHVHLNWNKQNSIQLTNSLAFLSRHK